MSTSEVAGVAVGTASTEAERRLRSALGPPRSEPLPDCNGIQGRTLAWDSLVVVVSDEDGGDLVLVGWIVSAEGRRFDYDLPYGVDIGTPMRTVLEQVPRSEGYALDEGPFTGDYVVRTREEPYVFWRSREGDGSGHVDDVSFRSSSLECD